MSRRYDKIIEELVLFLGASVKTQKHRERMAPTTEDFKCERAEALAYKNVMQHLQYLIKLRRCRVCGCTEDDCTGCFKKTGRRCQWVAKDLCSACQVFQPPSNQNHKRMDLQ